MTPQYADEVSGTQRHHAWRVRLGPVLLGVGLFAGVVCSVAVALARPDTFDPGKACGLRFGISDVSVDVANQFFPPGARCTFHDVPGRGTVSLDYVTAGTSTTLAIGLVAVALLVAVGLVLTVLPMFGRSRRTATSATRTGWPLTLLHLAAAFLLGLATMYLAPYVALVAAIYGDWFGVTAMAALLIFFVVAVAVALDAGLGPRQLDPIGSRRRGTAVGLTGCAAILLIVLTGHHAAPEDLFPLPAQPPIGPAWHALSVALLFVAVVGAQRWWTTSTEPSREGHVTP